MALTLNTKPITLVASATPAVAYLDPDQQWTVYHTQKDATKTSDLGIVYIRTETDEVTTASSVTDSMAASASQAPLPGGAPPVLLPLRTIYFYYAAESGAAPVLSLIPSGKLAGHI